MFVANAASGQEPPTISERIGNVDAWDIKYHVFHETGYIKWSENQYFEGDEAFTIYDGKYLQVILLNVGSRCFVLLPIPDAKTPDISTEETTCRLFNMIKTETKNHIQRKYGTQSLDI